MKRVNIEDFDKIIIRDGEVPEFYLQEQKYNGIVFEIFNDKLTSEFEVAEGIKNGLEIVYYPNGLKESESFYKNGYLDGLTKNYSEEGYLEEEAFFEKGICLWHKLYDKSGNITEEFKISEDSDDYARLKIYRKNELK